MQWRFVSAIHMFEETGNRWTYDRDIALQNICGANTIALHEYPSNGLVRRLRNRDDWAEIRSARMAQKILPTPGNPNPMPTCKSDTLPDKDDPMFGATPIGKVQKGGRVMAVADLRSFLNHRSRGYLYHISAHDLSEYHCSRLSPHLAWGTLPAREVMQSIGKRRAQLTPGEKETFGRNLTALASRLARRCHFIQNLKDQPEIETQCMHIAFEGLHVNDHNAAYFQHGPPGIPATRLSTHVCVV